MSTNAFVSETLAQYTPRAPTYDASHGGWHAQLGQDFVDWLPPPRGGAVLDLACGTGLVTLPFAQAVGPDGIVVGVDITDAMLDEARRKPLTANSGEVQWVHGDITNLSTLPAVQDVATQRGGFDVISCCSALVLLQDPRAAIAHWASSYLKPGTGRIIVDVPTEDPSLQYLFNYPLRRALGKLFVFDQEWVTDKSSLEDLFLDAGLAVETSFRTRSYIPEKWYRADQAMEVFDEKTHAGGGPLSGLVRDEGDAVLEKAKQAWPGIWDAHLDQGGRLWDGHALYVVIGRRV